MVPIRPYLLSTAQTCLPRRYHLNLLSASWPIVRHGQIIHMFSRSKAALNFRRINCQFFVTIEPIMVFDLEEFAGRIRDIDPIFVNIGADSKGHNLPEPSWEEVRALIDKIREAGIEVRLKKNLNRLNKKEGICQEKISEVSGM